MNVPEIKYKKMTIGFAISVSLNIFQGFTFSFSSEIINNGL